MFLWKQCWRQLAKTDNLKFLVQTLPNTGLFPRTNHKFLRVLSSSAGAAIVKVNSVRRCKRWEFRWPWQPERLYLMSEKWRLGFLLYCDEGTGPSHSMSRVWENLDCILQAGALVDRDKGGRRWLHWRWNEGLGSAPTLCPDKLLDKCRVCPLSLQNRVRGQMPFFCSPQRVVILSLSAQFRDLVLVSEVFFSIFFLFYPL